MVFRELAGFVGRTLKKLKKRGRERTREEKRGRDKETKRQKDKETKRGRERKGEEGRGGDKRRRAKDERGVFLKHECS